MSCCCLGQQSASSRWWRHSWIEGGALDPRPVRRLALPSNAAQGLLMQVVMDYGAGQNWDSHVCMSGLSIRLVPLPIAPILRVLVFIAVLIQDAHPGRLTFF